MSQMNDLWSRQFVEGVKEIARLYLFYEDICDFAAFDLAKERGEELNKAYGLSLDFLDLVKLGRSLLAERDLPKK